MTDKNRINIPEYCMVLLVGPTGCGKSTFAARHFRSTEVISSDRCRGIVSDDENDLEATHDAFALLNYTAETRLKRRRLTVIDATNVRSEDRRDLISLAKRYHALVVAFVFDVPEALCHERNALRPDRAFGPHVVRNHIRSLRRGQRRMDRDGIRFIYRFKSEEEVDAVEILRDRLWVDKRDEQGPFDIIGDIHGCATELEQLLEKLGYGVTLDESEGDRRYSVTAPEGRRVIFLGDLVDRGPRVPDVLRIAKSMVDDGIARCVLGNHEAKLGRAMRGRNVKLTHGLAETMEQFESESDAFKKEMLRFIDGLISHFVLDDGRLVVAHAGLREEMQNRSSGKVRSFAMYGETTGETDDFGLPVRFDWASEYRGKARVVYGHTPVPEAEWINNTLCIDTGCVFGGKLTALSYPEMELVEVPAERTYMEPARPLIPASDVTSDPNAAPDALLDLEDVTGKRIISTRLRRAVTLRDDQSAAALEVMSRFAIDPRWLIYLPPTMSPSETSAREGFLEHPEDALRYFKAQGVESVVAQEKHMGSRAVLVVTRDDSVALRRFGIESDALGAIYTRTGRPFFYDPAIVAGVLARVSKAAEQCGLWDALETDWLCLDAEIMPWSVKAQSLIEHQYGAVGAAANAGLQAALVTVQQGVARGLDLETLREKMSSRFDNAVAYRKAYGHYVWPVEKLEDLRIAPFHLLGSEGGVHDDKSHRWHMEQLRLLCEADEDLLFQTDHRFIDVADEAQVQAACEWWLEMTAKGGEGMVVKPMDFVTRGPRGYVQPAVKCRGREYLRIIYGPDYDRPEHLTRLRRRGLGRKRALALQEFALGIEALERFANREPLRRVHECVFGVLAMESEAVDPRL